MANQKHSSATTVEPVFEISRTIDAPRELVFKMWTDPAHLSNWWGPHCFKSRCELDVRVGGKYRITMVDPDGVEFPMHGVYREITPPERIVMTIVVDDHPKEWFEAIYANISDKNAKLHEQLLTVVFEEVDGKTNVAVQARFENVAERDAFVKVGMTEGWSQQFEKLSDLVAKVA